MDEWTAKYLEEWQVDFGDELNAEQSLRFIQDVLSALKQLPSSGVETVAPSVIATIKSQQDLEESLDYSQGVVFEAAISSPLDSSDLAQVTRLLVQELPHPRNEWFQRKFANNARERWNGPDQPGPEKDLDQCIQEWISLNIFVAHLTRVQAAPLEDFALRTLNRAFDPGSYLSNEVEYQVPAGAAWMRNWGKELYVWKFSAIKLGIDRARWNWWKRGF
ncbi:uncharacterized protein ASPGLDRAFT_127923 [Aspergillus glaucus CBS 516.65]|uniref:Uncharacterized protein n=1 Tax=Aspergillus glaucus CBS 516.65 TaxID=1160497 RepID=A0A1L9VIE2_ASPGL|nr:hypothetical protein ASPGLDRAFT_127923 [Aspergillus glaucus CBS 516.65]OJJ83645.1 hypothetical protein ASPGLDRAFT_127923 [Aspergillus glaucus CBS 516.65]